MRCTVGTVSVSIARGFGESSVAKSETAVTLPPGRAMVAIRGTQLSEPSFGVPGGQRRLAAMPANWAKELDSQALEEVVGATGFEPVTPAV